MLTTSASVVLGITFVLVGAANVWLILQSSAHLKDSKSSARLIAAHRIGGYIFMTLFLVMAYFMVARWDAAGDPASPGATIHLTLALIISPLLFVKVLVARYYKSYYGFLMPVGLAIFVLSFVLVAITVAPHLAHQPRIETVFLTAVDLPPDAIDINIAASTMEKRCTKCHTLDRVVAARKDTRGWQATVNRMRMLPDSGISGEEARLIFSYLAAKMTPKGPTVAAELEVAKALVDQRCGRCHSLDRVYKTAQTEEEWKSTVARMAGYAAGGGGAFQQGEIRRIVAYLGVTQTPAAVKRRKEEAAIAVTTPDRAATLSLIAPRQVIPATIWRPGRYDFRLIGFISLVCLSMLTLAIKRPVRGAARTASETQAPVRAGAPASRPSLILRLASITPQTADAKTLRFVVSDGGPIAARPGQFLTFSLLFDGQRVSRSYTICSSAARSGYAEITPKRVNGGCASVFLNDRAQVGMTVEAKGPYGQFYLDERKHRNVVMLAAGSGITPMIAMLRYINVGSPGTELEFAL